MGRMGVGASQRHTRWEYVRDVAADRSGDVGVWGTDRGVSFVCVCALDCVFVLVFFFFNIFFYIWILGLLELYNSL